MALQFHQIHTPLFSCVETSFWVLLSLMYVLVNFTDHILQLNSNMKSYNKYLYTNIFLGQYYT